MPNTYYAKIRRSRYIFSQGALYLWASIWQANLWPALILAAIAAWKRRHELLGRTLLIALPIYFLYVAKIGGDYMVGRLCVAAMPFIAIGADVALAGFTRAGRRRSGARIVDRADARTSDREVRWFLADERTHTPLTSFSPITVASEMFERAQLVLNQVTKPGLRPIVAVDAVGMVGYYNLPLEIIDCWGLTDRHVAHMALTERGRPGHEKRADMDIYASVRSRSRVSRSTLRHTTR